MVVPLSWTEDERSGTPSLRDDAASVAEANGTTLLDLRCLRDDEDRTRSCRRYHDDWLRLLHGAENVSEFERLVLMRRLACDATHPTARPNDAAAEIYAKLGVVEQLFCRKLYDHLREACVVVANSRHSSDTT